LNSTLHKTEVKINFARHCKAWGAWSYYSSMQFDIQHWIEVSAECEVPVELTHSPLHPGADLLTGKL